MKMPQEIDFAPGHSAPVLRSAPERAIAIVNSIAMAFSTIALLAAAIILTESVFVRYFLKRTTDWQDEYSVMLLVAATFLSASYVQSLRGHIGIEALDGVLPERINQARKRIVDVVSVVFCAFFTWKSWTLSHEAWTDGQTTSSTIASPLWIPYGTMALGMSLLTLQILLQVTHRSATRRSAKSRSQS